MKKSFLLFTLFLLSLTALAAEVQLSSNTYAYNKWSADKQMWYVSLSTSDSQYNLRLYYKVADNKIPTPYRELTAEDIDLTASYINATTGSKSKYEFDSANLNVERTTAGKMAITGSIVSGETTFTLNLSGNGTPKALSTGSYMIETSNAILFSTEYVHPGSASLLMGRDATTGDSLTLTLVGETLENDFFTADNTLSCDFTTITHANGTQSKLFAGWASVLRESESYIIKAHLLFNNNTLYDVDMTYTMVTGEVIDVVCTNTDWTDYCHTFGAAWAQGSDSRFENILVQMGNLFELEPCDLDLKNFLCDMWLPGAPASLPSVSVMTPVSARLEMQGYQLVLLAEFIGSDLNYYKLDMRYNRPEPTKTIDLAVENAEFYNALENGYFQVSGYTADSAHWVSLLVMSSEVEGAFSIEDNTLQKDYTMVWEAATNTEFLLQWGEADIVMDGDGNITISAELLTKEDSVMYNVTMKSKYDKPRLTYDTQDTPIEHTFGANTENSMNLYETGTDNLYYLQLDLKDAASSLYCQLGFWISAIDDTYALPAGTYTIDRTREAGTLQASSGVVGGSINASFIGTYNPAEMTFSTPLWFLDRGTATVTTTDGILAIEVEALNSYDQAVTIHFSDKVATGIDTLEAPQQPVARKRLEGRHIVISNGNSSFDLLGRQH